MKEDHGLWKRGSSSVALLFVDIDRLGCKQTKARATGRR